MKMTLEDYLELKSDIKAVSEATGLEICSEGKTGLMRMHLLHCIVNQDRAYDDKHPSFVGGYWKRVLSYTGRDYCYLYDKGLDDTHIATALRKIKNELEKEISK